MNGWLCYDEIGAKRNAWFINHLIEKASARGISLSLHVIGNPPFAFPTLPDFAIVRFICPALNEWFEAQGVRVYNNAKTAKIACDKWQTYRFFLDHGIPVLQTELASSRSLPFPLVAKARDGHGGTEVFWVENETELLHVKDTLCVEDFIVQRPSDILGRDMRVYAVGGKIVASVLRESNADFRSNYSLGGNIRLVEADEQQKKIVKKIYDLLGFDFIGIDFLPTKNGWVVNELEDSAGARMLYALSDIDIADLMIDHVLLSLQ